MVKLIQQNNSNHFLFRIIYLVRIFRNMDDKDLEDIHYESASHPYFSEPLENNWFEDFQVLMTDSQDMNYTNLDSRWNSLQKETISSEVLDDPLELSEYLIMNKEPNATNKEMTNTFESSENLIQDNNSNGFHKSIIPTPEIQTATNICRKSPEIQFAQEKIVDYDESSDDQSSMDAIVVHDQENNDESFVDEKTLHVQNNAVTTCSDPESSNVGSESEINDKLADLKNLLDSWKLHVLFDYFVGRSSELFFFYFDKSLFN